MKVSGILFGEFVASGSQIKSLNARFEPNDILYGKPGPNRNKVYRANMAGA